METDVKALPQVGAGAFPEACPWVPPAAFLAAAFPPGDPAVDLAGVTLRVPGLAV